MRKVFAVVMEHPRMARFQTVIPGSAVRPWAPGSASNACARVAPCESPTTMTLIGPRPSGPVGAADDRLPVASSPTSPESAGRAPVVEATTPNPTASTATTTANCARRGSAQSDAAPDRLADEEVRDRRERHHRAQPQCEQRTAADPGAGGREDEVERPVPQVHLVGDVADPPHRSGLETPSEHTG